VTLNGAPDNNQRIDLSRSQPDPLAAFLNSLGETKDIVFFVGAGISLSAGYPSWRYACDAALKLAKDRGLSIAALAYATEKLTNLAYYDLFQILKDELTAPAYREIATLVFGGENKPSHLHRLLTKIQSRGIITTNFDECLLSACVLERGGPPLTEISYVLASDKFFIVKPHGSIQNPATMVLTKSDWKRVESDGSFKDLLTETIGHNQLLFMGYGLGDPDFNHIWDSLLRDRVFRAPALYCCVKGSIQPSRITELRDKNVQVIEFEDNGTFAFVPKVLSAIVARKSAAATALPSPSTSQALERYVLLCLEFSQAQASRLMVVCKAIILEALTKEPSGILTKVSLASHVYSTLGQESKSIQEAMTAALAELVDAKTVSGGANISFASGKKKQLEEQVAKAESTEKTWVHRILREQAEVLKMQIEPHQAGIVVELLDRVLMAIGNEVAELFLFNRPPKGEVSRVEEIIAIGSLESGRSAADTLLYQKTLKRLLFDPSEQDEGILFQRLQAYFISSAYLLNPTSEKLLADYAKEHWVYLDSSILLPALAVGHPANAVYKHLLHSTIRLGMKLKVLPEMLNEVEANVRSARKAFEEFRQTGVDIKEVLKGSLALSGSGNGNVFLEGYLNQLGIDPTLSSEAYMRNVLGSGSGLNKLILNALGEMYQIELDSIEASETDPSELNYITDSIEHLRKQGGRFKTRLLCEHEARQFVAVHIRRRQHPDLATKIWFVTTDHFITELQRLERERYPLPMSYTPRMWFQYLNLVDIDSRGSRHFSRLQPTMRFGVITGDLGLEAIKTLLAEQKSLIEKGVVTVKPGLCTRRAPRAMTPPGWWLAVSD
jgi:hypothetical protein